MKEAFASALALVAIGTFIWLAANATKPKQPPPPPGVPA